ncbi:hypothetical protein ISF_04472 [Cordyceps fumosorosea ARSEF 2679]|uniref:Uncharacterized protein n=1 Tax=Cordyceps fumosorosea (strain ARSEF 2679) TaxID=1081104 RepID=A0A162J7X1_CORFA|nr:hypothetical protein ISF_04472 [Cordyceps fumosorosea ARSEF 2679]OAA65062.1 hypothetical protein ISF_04472 [Cordyceps fumosorosea ARSEF 2679]
MAAPETRDPLDALQALFNDALIQTGKAIRASRRDSQGNLPLPQGMSTPKLPSTVDAFHKILDDLESDIINAKSVVLRDLNQLQAKQSTDQQQQVQSALPIESQTKEPLSIDVESSPPPSTIAHTKPALAPFPVMDAGNMTSGDASLEIEETTLYVDNSTKKNGVKAEALAAPEAPMMTDSNFTDMQFSLAPGDGSQGQNTNAAGSFDIPSFAPGDAILSVDNMLSGSGQPANSNGSDTNGPTTVPATTETIKTEPVKGTGATNESNFEEFFTNDASQADGMDFDFSLGGGGGNGGGGMGEDTFDDLMNDRDGNFELMTNEDFDAAFFGLDNKDGTS